MDLKENVAAALGHSLHADHVRLVDEDGISGFVVSTLFRGLSALDRQKFIHKALRSAPVKFSQAELRQVLAIAALTPAEYEAVAEGGGVLR